MQQLTGGTLLSRDKEFIVFYRGKDFLPPAVSVAIEERRNSGNSELTNPKQNKEERHLAVRDASEPKFDDGASGDGLQEKGEKETLASKGRTKAVSLTLKKVETKLSQVHLNFLFLLNTCCGNSVNAFMNLVDARKIL